MRIGLNRSLRDDRLSRRWLMMWWDWNHWGWGMGLMMFLGVAFWGGIIALIVWGVTRLTRRGAAAGGGKTDPFDIARERYARGEIDREQFEQMKKDLS
jgi:putative membrane protein